MAEETVPFSLYDEICSHTVSLPMKKTLTAEQELIYRGLKRVNKLAFIAGGFPAYNIGWKAQVGDVDMYAPVFTRLKNFDRAVKNFMERFYQELCLLCPAIEKTTTLYDLSYMHEHANQGMMRIQLHKYNVDIVMKIIPRPPRALPARDRRVFTMLYTVSCFDNMFCRVTIQNYHPRQSEYIVFGRFDAAVNEINMKLYTIQACQRQLDDLIQMKQRRLRRFDVSVWKRYQATLTSAYNRVLKYLPTSELEAIEYVPRTWVTVHLPYGINPNLRSVLPTCLRFLEKRVKLNPEYLELLMEYQMSINFPGGEEDAALEHLPIYPKLKKCQRCRYC